MTARTRTAVLGGLAAALILVSGSVAADAATPSAPSVVNATASGAMVSFGSGTYSFSNFTTNGNIGLNVSRKAGVRGAGMTATTLRMTPYSSTKAGSVPTAKGRTNPLYLMQVNGTPTLSNFTLLGTSQGHLYNGLDLVSTTNARVSSVRVKAIPGNAYYPPGETFGINDNRSTGSTFSNIEVDGAGVGAAGFAANNSSNITVNGAYLHDNPRGAGATFWASSNITLTDVRSVGNRSGINFERSTGRITLVRPTLKPISGSGGHDLSFASDRSSATVVIKDPVFNGSKLRIAVPSTYIGVRNTITRSSIKVYVNGVDRTSSIVQWS